MAKLCLECYRVCGNQTDAEFQCKHNEKVLIDDNIVNTIKLFNQKGYKTRYCCGGH